MSASKLPNLDPRQDELLVVRCQLGERPAFEELIQRWNAPLGQYVRRLTGNDAVAQDILQDTWLRVLRGIHRLRDGTKLRGWLFGIAHHVLMDHWRSKYTVLQVRDMDVTDLPAGDMDADLEDDISTLQLELSRLPVTEREVLTLFYLHELSLADVAEVLGVPVGTVKSRLFRARQMLRRELEAKGDLT